VWKSVSAYSYGSWTIPRGSASVVYMHVQCVVASMSQIGLACKTLQLLCNNARPGAGVISWVSSTSVLQCVCVWVYESCDTPSFAPPSLHSSTKSPVKTPKHPSKTEQSWGKQATHSHRPVSDVPDLHGGQVVHGVVRSPWRPDLAAAEGVGLVERWWSWWGGAGGEGEGSGSGPTGTSVGKESSACPGLVVVLGSLLSCQLFKGGPMLIHKLF